MRQNQKTAHAVRGLITIGTLYSCLYCMLASGVMLQRPLAGGAMYLLGRSGIAFIRLRRPCRDGMVEKPLRRMGFGLLIALLACWAAAAAVHPFKLENAKCWRLAGIALCAALRPELTRFAAERPLRAGGKTAAFAWAMGAQALLLLPLLFLLPSGSMDRGTAWTLIGGYAACGVLELFSLEQPLDSVNTFSGEDKAEIEALKRAHACRVYRAVTLAAVAALRLTQVMGCTYIAFSAGSLLEGMAVGLLCTYAACLAAEAVRRVPRFMRTDLGTLMNAGSVVWLLGLILFFGAADRPGTVAGYFSAALCTAGAAIVLRAVSQLEEHMDRAAAFALGHAHGGGAALARRSGVRCASVLGQMAALLGLALMSIFAGDRFSGDWAAAVPSFRFSLILPALALTATALVFSVRFPLTKLHLEKLRRYLKLREEGGENVPLRDQLEAAVVKKSMKRYGIKVVEFILWPLCYHKVRGLENVQLDEDTACVFVCNHGEINGPIVTTLYVPYPFRPWTTYEMTDESIVADRTMNGTFQDVKGWPRKALDWAMHRFGAPFLTWLMRSVDCIPVYHDNPRKLMQTFRQTVTAMEAGDNILLFPENAATSADHRYAREGVSEFFTGFTMIGQLFNQKTGKSPLFVPLYADWNKRVITFGKPTRYDPDAPSGEEKERLCGYLRDEMLRVAGMKEG